jgi:hypothetical protein
LTLTTPILRDVLMFGSNLTGGWGKRPKGSQPRPIKLNQTKSNLSEGEKRRKRPVEGKTRLKAEG